MWAARIIRRGLGTWACALGAACASAATPGAGDVGADALTADQLRAAIGSPDETLYQTLSRVRPHWLIAAEGQPDPTVYVDGVQTGAPATLHVIAARSVEGVRFLTPQAAAARYGGRSAGGAIDVVLGRASVHGMSGRSRGRENHR